MCLDAMFLALLIVGSYLSINVGYAKISFQLLAVFLIAEFLSLKHGLIVIALYIVMGIIGIPVFAGFGGGPAYALSFTFGFVYGFLFGLLAHWLVRDVLLARLRFPLLRSVLGLCAALLVIYLIGFVHAYLILTLYQGKSDTTVGEALMLFIVPYIPFDIGKLVIAAFASSKYARILIPVRSRHYEELPSTNAYLKEKWRVYPNLTFIDASYQSQGRGRLGRAWEAEKGDALLCSLLIKDKALLKDAGLLSLLAAHAVRRVLVDFRLKDVSVKWPNDVYASGKKIAGILLEGVSVPEMEAVIIGIGLNLNQENFPEGLAHPATSVFLESGRVLLPKEAKKRLYKALKKDLASFKKGDRSFLTELNENHYLSGKEAYAQYQGQKQKISVLRIDDDGALIALIDGEEKRLIADEITFEA